MEAAQTKESAAVSEVLLLTALQVAVPMWIMDLWALPPGARTNQVRLWAEDAADVIAARGDIIQYGGKRVTYRISRRRTRRCSLFS